MSRGLLNRPEFKHHEMGGCMFHLSARIDEIRSIFSIGQHDKSYIPLINPVNFREFSIQNLRQATNWFQCYNQRTSFTVSGMRLWIWDWLRICLNLCWLVTPVYMHWREYTFLNPSHFIFIRFIFFISQFSIITFLNNAVLFLGEIYWLENIEK
jgi:hypothetical protein